MGVIEIGSVVIAFVERGTRDIAVIERGIQ